MKTYDLNRELKQVKAQRDELRRRLQIAEGKWQRVRRNVIKIIDRLLEGEPND